MCVFFYILTFCIIRAVKVSPFCAVSSRLGSTVAARDSRAQCLALNRGRIISEEFSSRGVQLRLAYDGEAELFLSYRIDPVYGRVARHGEADRHSGSARFSRKRRRSLLRMLAGERTRRVSAAVARV